MPLLREPDLDLTFFAQRVLLKACEHAHNNRKELARLIADEVISRIK